MKYIAAMGLLCLFPFFTFAQGTVATTGSAPLESSTGRVKTEVVEIVSDEMVDGFRQMEFKAMLDGQEVVVDTRDSFTEGLRYDVEVGDEVYLEVIYQNGEVQDVFLGDVVRIPALLWISAFFAGLILAVGRWRGLFALVGLAVTLLVLFGGVLPAILAGRDPVFVTILGSVAILAVNMHLSHGLSRTTFIAYLSTVIGLIFAWVFSVVFVGFANLSGLAGEEAVLLFLSAEGVRIPSGVLLAGIILGAVGVLDDIAITQTETVTELQEANPVLQRKELFLRAMRIGRHHIASTVNTLVLAYVGVALPLFLLYMHTQGVSVTEFINKEQVAEELVRTIAGTAALVLTVPIATWFAVWNKTR